MANFTCNKCNRTMDENNFYTYKDGTKFDLCKKCLTMHINNFDPNTFLWLLEKADVPYIEEEWNVLRDRAFSKDPHGMNGMSVYGKYLSKMKLKQWKQYGWADTAKFEEQKKERDKARAAELEQLKIAQEMMKEKYERGEITESEYKTYMSTEVQNQNLAPPTNYGVGPNNAYNEDNFLSEDEMVDPAAELTKEDKLYLAMKWGRLYRPNEWVELEKKYNEMMNSFDIQDSDTTGTLILICKTYLKMNQAIDSGDMDGYQKLARVYDSLRKSAKFTAAQNKDQKGDYVDSIGELVAMCEKNGFIPRYATDIPQDKVDATLKDMNNYVKKLVTQDLGFGQQIEDALRKIEIQRQMNEQGDMDIELEDEELQDFYEDVEEQKVKDMEVIMGEEDD